MPTVPERPRGANSTDPPVDVDLADPTARAAWLDAIGAQLADVVAAGLDATAPPARRDLGRRAARRIITEAQRALGSLLAAVGSTHRSRAAKQVRR